MARIIILLLLLCVTSVWMDTSTEVLKPGALVAPLGRVLIVEDVVNIKYELHGLLKLPRQLESIDTNLLTAMNVLGELSKNPNSSTMVSQTVKLQLFRLQTLHKTIVAAGNSIPASQEDLAKKVRSETRRKRGLFNFVGLIQSTLFGTATAEDVAKLGDRLNIVDQAVLKQNRVITQTFHAITALEAKVNAIISESNHLSRVVSNIINSIPTLEWLISFSEYLHAAESSAQALFNAKNELISCIVDAGLGRVDSQLVPVRILLQALQIAKTNNHLTPIFTDDEVEYYYPLLESTLTHNAILIHIPMLTHRKFNAWYLEPFPLYTNDTLFTLDKPTEIVIIDDDYSLLALDDPRVLSQCKSSYLHLHVCPAYVFAFIPVTKGICELAIIQSNVRTALKQCQYTPIARKPVFHVHLHNVQYFFFPEETNVILRCQDGGKHLFVKGYYKAPDYCEITCQSLKTLPTHHHFALNLNLTSDLIPLYHLPNLTLSELNIVSEKLTFISYLKESQFANLEDSLPFYFSRGFAIPTLTIPTFVLILAVMFLFCYYKSVSSKFTSVQNILSRKTLQTRVPVTAEPPIAVSPV